MSKFNERGAVAVEFALLAPVLILIVLGIVEFGRAYNTQVALTNAAREGARVMAISNSSVDAVTASMNAADSINPQLKSSDLKFTFRNIPQTTPAPTSCAASRQVTLTITYSLPTMTGIAGPFAMSGKGTMQCGG